MPFWRNKVIDRTPLVSGVFYQQFLQHLHQTRRPANYFEIGTLHGHTLSKARCPSVAVDPAFQITEPLPEDCQLFEMTSDAFFDKHDLSFLLGGPVDLAFLDGMHLFEYLLRDFINTERHSSASGMIVMHDCLPPDVYMTVRDPSDPEWQKSAHPGWWTGDVWKVVPVLWKYRPDLTVTVYDCPGTGIVTVTGLDPQNTALSDNYDRITAAAAESRLDHAAFDRYWKTVTVHSSASALSVGVTVAA